MVSQQCPDTSRWQALLADSSPADSAELESHLVSCSRCRGVLDDLAVGSSGWLRDANRLATLTAAEAEMTRTLHRLRDDLPDDHAGPPIVLDFLKPSDLSGVLGTLGRYQVLEILGRGACGIVLKALDPDLLRPVAIKVLAPYLAPSGTARQRFLREARAAAAVSHDHVVTIHAVEPADGLPYLVMEYVTGVSLQGRLDRDGPLPPRDIARIGHQAACGLAAAHAQGLVHRDIKPANILLENGVERVKITDFGLARAADDARLTQSGVAAGTPLYMSPEQARGETVDPRSDLFSLGSVLYTLATGFPPFRAESTMGVLNRITNNSPRPIRETIPDFPPDLEKIIMQLLEKDPAERFQLAADVSFRLTGFLSGPPKEPEPFNDGELERRPTKPTKWWVTALCLIAAAAMVAVVLTFRTPKGTLIVEVDDPEIKVAIDGEELKITGAGPQEVRLKPGDHHVTASKDGKPAQVSQEIVTITKNGKQVVKVTIKPEPLPVIAGDPIRHDLFASRLKALYPDLSQEKANFFTAALAAARSGVTPVVVDGDRLDTHPKYEQLKKHLLEGATAEGDTAKIERAVKDAYTLAETIRKDSAISAALNAGRKGANQDPDWHGRLNELEGKVTAIMKSLPSPPTQPDIKFADRPKKLQLLTSEYKQLMDKCRASASRLADLKLVVANSMRESIRSQLEADFSKLSTVIQEIEKVGIELGAKPASSGGSNPFAASDSWETRQKNVVTEFQDLMGRISKTTVGKLLANVAPGADPDKAVAGLSGDLPRELKRLIVVRDEWTNLLPKAQKELDRWEKATLQMRFAEERYKAGIIPIYEYEPAKLEMKQAERALQGAEDSMRKLIADLEAIAKEIGIAHKPEAEFKKLMDEYEELRVRLVKTPTGRLLVTLQGSWSEIAIKASPGADVTLGIKLLHLRGEIETQSTEYTRSINELASIKTKLSRTGQDQNAVDRAEKETQNIQLRIQVLRGLIVDLKRLAEEIDPPGKQ
jgi:hypothetical protein